MIQKPVCKDIFDGVVNLLLCSLGVNFVFIFMLCA